MLGYAECHDIHPINGWFIIAKSLCRGWVRDCPIAGNRRGRFGPLAAVLPWRRVFSDIRRQHPIRPQQFQRIQ